jgi:hypothetical protein
MGRFLLCILTALIYFITIAVVATPLKQPRGRDTPYLQPWYYVKNDKFEHGGCEDYLDKLQEAYVETIAMAQS